MNVDTTGKKKRVWKINKGVNDKTGGKKAMSNLSKFFGWSNIFYYTWGTIHFIQRTFSIKKIINRMRLMRSYSTKSQISLAIPTIINLESTNRCNLNCFMCPIDKMKRPVGDMSLDLLHKIVDEVSGKTELIIPSVFGEPLLHKDICSFIYVPKTAGIDVHITTNGVLLNPAYSEELLSAQLDKLLVGIDASCEETYNKIRVGGNFNKVVENVKDFAGRKKQNVVVVVQFIKQMFNSLEVEDFKEYWKPFDVKVKIKEIQNWAGQLNTDRPSEIIITAPCDYLWRNMTVLWNGDVVPCCRDLNGQEVVGNLNKQSVAEVWNSERMQELRKIHAKGKRCSIKLCKECDHFPSKHLWATALIDISTLNKR